MALRTQHRAARELIRRHRPVPGRVFGALFIDHAPPVRIQGLVLDETNASQMALEHIADLTDQRGHEAPAFLEIPPLGSNTDRRAIHENAWSGPHNSFVDCFGEKNVEASLLLLHEIGFISASDPRFLGTVTAIEQHLRRRNHLYRYACEDDFGTPRTSFTVCTLWYIDALAAIGREEGREIFEHLLSCRNHLGLLSEDIDPDTGESLGQLSTDLLDGGPHRLGDALEQELGGEASHRPGEPVRYRLYRTPVISRQNCIAVGIRAVAWRLSAMAMTGPYFEGWFSLRCLPYAGVGRPSQQRHAARVLAE